MPALQKAYMAVSFRIFSQQRFEWPDWLTERGLYEQLAILEDHWQRKLVDSTNAPESYVVEPPFKQSVWQDYLPSRVSYCSPAPLMLATKSFSLELLPACLLSGAGGHEENDGVGLFLPVTPEQAACLPFSPTDPVKGCPAWEWESTGHMFIHILILFIYSLPFPHIMGTKKNSHNKTI